MAEWYYAKKDKKIGPVTEAELKDLAAEGTLRPGDLVWTEGMNDWAKAEKATGFSFPGDSSDETSGRNLPREGVSARPPRPKARSRDEERRRPSRSWEMDDDDDDDDFRSRGRRSRRRPERSSSNALVIFLCLGGGVAVLSVIILAVVLATEQRHDPPRAVPQPIVKLPNQPPINVPQPLPNMPLPGQKTSADIAPIPLDGMQRSWTGNLVSTDAVDVGRPLAFCKVYTFPMAAGQFYTIDMESRDFDAYLVLEDPDGQYLMEDDDSGGLFNARIVFEAKRTGLFRIIASSFKARETGNYVLRINPGQFPVNPVDPNHIPGGLVLRNGMGIVVGQLTVNDPRDAVHKNSGCKVFPVQFEQGKTYEIRMSGFDAKKREFRIRVEDGDGKELTSSKASLPTATSVTFTAPQQGEYRVIATTANSALGPFTITVLTKKK